MGQLTSPSTLDGLMAQWSIIHVQLVATPLTPPCSPSRQPLAQLCKMVLPRMKARGKGLIVNIGSGIASAMPEAPLLSGGCGGWGSARGRAAQASVRWCGTWELCGVEQGGPRCMPCSAKLTRYPVSACSPSPSPVYGAAKTYVDSLSRSLDAEAAAYGVRVQNLWPMFVCEWDGCSYDGWCGMHLTGPCRRHAGGKGGWGDLTTLHLI